MESRKFIDIAKTFSKEENKRFKKFLESPFFNSNENLVKAFEYLRKSSDDFTGDLPTKEELHKNVYAERPFKDENVRYILSELLQLAEEFLGVTNLYKKKVQLRKNILSELNERCIDKLFERNLKFSKELLNDINPNDPNYYMTKYEIIEEERTFNSKRTEFLADGVEDKSTTLTSFYAIEILKEYRFLLNQNINPENRDRKIPFKDEVMSFVFQNNFLAIPIVEVIYYQVLTLLEPSEEAHYYRLKELTEKHSDELTYVEKYNSFVMLLNFANRKAGEGNEIFRREKFELHKISAQKNAITKDSFIAPLRFEAIVEDGLRLQEYDWTEGFIMNYKHMLPEEERESMVFFCLSQISYSKKEYEKALEYISNSSFSHIMMNLRKRNLTVKLYYELDYLDTLTAYIDSYRHYLSKNEKIMPPQAYLYYTGFLKIVAELVKAKSLPEKNRLNILRQKLDTVGMVYDKGWLIDKARIIEDGALYQRKA